LNKQVVLLKTQDCLRNCSRKVETTSLDTWLDAYRFIGNK